MAQHFLFQAALTQPAWAHLAGHPEGEEARLRTLAQKAGGKLVSLFYSTGEHDVLAVLEAPDTNVASALSVALSKAGHLQAVKTTTLFSNDEGVAFLHKAGALPFHAPQGMTV